MQITPTLGPGQAPGTTQPTLPVDANEIRRRQRLAEALMSQGMQTERIRHPLEAVGHVMQTGVGALWGDSARKAGTEREAFEMAQAQAAKNQDMAQAQARHQALAEALQGQGGQAEQIRQLLSDPATAPVGSQLAVKYLSKGPDKGTAMMQNFRMAQENPAFGQFLESRKPTTNINVSSGAKALSKGLSERALQQFDKATLADGQIRLYQTMDKLLDDPNVYTGTGGELISNVKKAAGTLLGVDVEGLPAAEAARKITDELALGFKKQSADPQTSNYERQIYERMATGLNDSAAGRKLMIKLRVSDLEDQKKQADIWRQHVTQDGNVDLRVYDALNQHAAQRQEKLGEFLVEANRISSGTQQPAPTAGLRKAVNPQTGEVLFLKDGKWQK